jgi:threonine dehydratase
VTFADEVRAASARLTGVADRTPLQLNHRLSQATGADVWLKREDLQLGRSYKVRGAYNLISQLPAAERSAGAVCASAGNHGQGVAIACRALGVRGRVYVPGTTPSAEARAHPRARGAWVTLVVEGDTYDAAARAALDYASVTGATLVPAFDAEATIVGQATLAVEVLDQLGGVPDTMVVPVGGVAARGIGALFAEESPGTRSSAWSRPARRACLRPWRPGTRSCWSRWTRSSTEPPCSASGT